MRTARRDGLELGIEGALPLRFEPDGFAGGTSAAFDILEESPGGETLGSDGDRLFAKVVGHDVSIQTLYPSGFESKSGRLVMRHGLEADGLAVAGVAPGGRRETEKYEGCRYQAAHGEIIG